MVSRRIFLKFAGAVHVFVVVVIISIINILIFFNITLTNITIIMMTMFIIVSKTTVIITLIMIACGLFWKLICEGKRHLLYIVCLTERFTDPRNPLPGAFNYR